MNEWAIASFLTGLLLLVSGYYAYSAGRTLHRTTPQFEMLPDERRFLRRQAWRRLINSGLMLLLAALLIGGYAAGLPQRAQEIGDRRDRLEAANGVRPPATNEEREFGRFFAGCVIAFLSLLFVIVAIAGLDLMATRRYATMKLHQIQTDRRAMIARQLEKWREERDQG